MDFGGKPEPEGRLDAVPGDDGVEQLVHVVEAEVAVVQQDPAAVLCRLLDEASSVHLLALTHRDRPVLCTAPATSPATWTCVLKTSGTGIADSRRTGTNTPPV